MRFRSAVDGSISGVRFYKGLGNGGTHTAHLWTSTGTLLASATFSGETSSGWQYVSFAAPVRIKANTTYVASYYAPRGHYADDSGYFAAAGVNSGPLHALKDGDGGPNGVYAYGARGTFPSTGWQSSNYWTDVVFTAGAPSSTPTPTASPTATAPSPASTPAPAPSASPTVAPSPSVSAAPTPTPSPAVSPAGGGSVVFADEFNGSGVDTSKWLVLHEHGDTSNSEAQCYLPANTSEGGGSLTEVARVENVTGCPTGSSTTSTSYSSGAVQMASFHFTYGTVEFRAKFAGGTGTWPAVWLLGADCQSPQWLPDPPSCHWPSTGSDEIDIAEIFGHDKSTVNQQVHSASSNAGCRPTVSDVSANWHTYTLVWAPGSLTWKIDGVTTCTTSSGVPSTPMFVIINTAVGGAGGQSVDNSTLPQATQVDYIHVTQ